MPTRSRFIPRQQGFTLIEIAIVLVIIGLLLGGVFKGQELIENSKAKNAANDMNAIIAAYNGYIDRYKRLPGDDGPLATLTARGGNWTQVTLFGNNNGAIASTAFETFTAGAGEGPAFWQHLKAANFITGNVADIGINALPRNAFGGLTGITSANVMPAAATGLLGNKVCLSQVPGKQALAMDNQLDDGRPNSGTLRATQGVAGTNTPPGANVPGGAAASYNESLIYTICRGM
ncbi:MAG: prepilin-type N-terminal cleavage/methylation domain-containing protein [Methylomonas sp.]|nr:prepilin-type N-terminal cleavage/methylation domain-containing protein [Methylomonas sp.]PPD19931.1 MAG: prepilin-type cleavage/methylation domain-containing protein [Methylomonas sp.]PPD25472.1 MAG: prepilin-type cleavage/methylation domain-containing protein [Methylomonas sp.]PPD36172.1 MAG: prepilin-type cleavage/methylation domain-containing protein [Methylomonas sp.]PPD39717.1 MAG: prepilin-type cleavage/methylation domain-containing protein [Methylomonas sp.]